VQKVKICEKRAFHWKSYGMAVKLNGSDALDRSRIIGMSEDAKNVSAVVPSLAKNGGVAAGVWDESLSIVNAATR
jgi:hypothetical protein